MRLNIYIGDKAVTFVIQFEFVVNDQNDCLPLSALPSPFSDASKNTAIMINPIIDTKIPYTLNGAPSLFPNSPQHSIPDP